MKAWISGQAGLALIVDERGHGSVLRAGRPEEEFAWNGVDEASLFGNADDVEHFHDINREATYARLTELFNQDTALHLALVAIDRESNDEVRVKAVRELEILLAQPTVFAFLSKLLRSAPMPARGDLRGTLLISFETSAKLLFSLIWSLDEVTHVEVVETGKGVIKQNRPAITPTNWPTADVLDPALTWYQDIVPTFYLNPPEVPWQKLYVPRREERIADFLWDPATMGFVARPLNLPTYGWVESKDPNPLFYRRAATEFRSMHRDLSRLVVLACRLEAPHTSRDDWISNLGGLEVSRHNAWFNDLFAIGKEYTPDELIDPLAMTTRSAPPLDPLIVGLYQLGLDTIVQIVSSKWRAEPRPTISGGVQRRVAEMVVTAKELAADEIDAIVDMGFRGRRYRWKITIRSAASHKR